MDTETAYALALYVDLVPAELRKGTGAILSKKLRDGETADNSGMTTGFIGTRTTIPANTTATVYVPTTSADKVTEGGKPLAKAPGAKFLRMNGDRAVLAVESGDYRFHSQL